MTTISERQRARFYIYKKETNSKRLYIYIYTQKARHFSKRRAIFIYKKLDNFRYAIFHENFEIDICIKKHDTLRYVKFLFTEIQTLRKKQDNFRYVFIYKRPWNF